MSLVDKAKNVREGEELNIQKIEEFLKQSIPELSGALKVLQFPSGFSNLTYLINVGENELVLRRPPFGTKAKTAHDMSREYRVLKALHPVFPYCPEPLIFSEDESVPCSKWFNVSGAGCYPGCIYDNWYRPTKGFVLDVDATNETINVSHSIMRGDVIDGQKLRITNINFGPVSENYLRQQMEQW